MRKLISSDEATVGNGEQHTSACSDCPYRRDALPGWLGGTPLDAWLIIPMMKVEPCHAIEDTLCAGMAIYRANLGTPNSGNGHLVLPADTKNIFASWIEFHSYHNIFGRSE